VIDLQFRETGDGKTLVPYWKYEVEPVENQTAEEFDAIVGSTLMSILAELEKGAQTVAAGLDSKPVKQTPQTTNDSSTTANGPSPHQ